MRARAVETVSIDVAESLFGAGFRAPVAVAIAPSVEPVHAYRALRACPLDAVTASGDPVTRTRKCSRKITTNRKVSRYGSKFRTGRAQAKICESAHPATHLDESETP